jgi:hypothetical protein
VQYTTYVAQYSYAELVATAKELTAAAVQHDPVLATLVKSAVDVKANRVSVLLRKTTSTAGVEAILARFGAEQLSSRSSTHRLPSRSVATKRPDRSMAGRGLPRS